MHTTTLFTLFLAALTPAVLASPPDYHHGSYKKSSIPFYPTGPSTGGIRPTRTGGIYPTGTGSFTLPTGGIPTGGIPTGGIPTGGIPSGFMTRSRKHGGPKTDA